MSQAKALLGRYLFYDKRMSVNGTQSCASCHRQELAFTDGRATALGATGQDHPRSAMSLVNVAYAGALTWSNPNLRSLEEQALIPMLSEHPVELGLRGRVNAFLNQLPADPVYRALFPRAFPEAQDPFTLANVAKALAAFERTIISARSPYDRYHFGGDPRAISDSAQRGEALFFGDVVGGLFSLSRRIQFQRRHCLRRPRQRAHRVSQYGALQHARNVPPIHGLTWAFTCKPGNSPTSANSKLRLCGTWR